MSNQDVILKIEDLKKQFLVSSSIIGRNKKYLKAVDGVSFEVRRGETLGIVGESGCGKSTMARLILRFIKATEGRVYFEGKDILEMNSKEIRQIRKDMQIVFQDPFATLNPKMTIGELIAEPLNLNFKYSKDEIDSRVKKIIHEVGMDESVLQKYAHEFSGGQRQRICIARALIMNPKFMICDESVSALDVSVQGQIINLLSDLKEQYNMTYIFISHDLSVIRHVSDRVGVLYLGKMVELGDTEQIFNNPNHPYTRALISAIPVPDPDIKSERILLQGDIPNPMENITGCKFRTRCRQCMDICKTVEPEFKKLNDNRFLACHLK